MLAQLFKTNKLSFLALQISRNICWWWIKFVHFVQIFVAKEILTVDIFLNVIVIFAGET